MDGIGQMDDRNASLKLLVEPDEAARERWACKSGTIARRSAGRMAQMK
jgi:hypothetical protein